MTLTPDIAALIRATKLRQRWLSWFETREDALLTMRV
jgi:hypothetical protein